jgi:hypothetical protein
MRFGFPGSFYYWYNLQGSFMKKNWYFLLALAFLLAALTLAWQQGIIFPPHTSYDLSLLPEAKLQRIPLAKPLSSWNAEISSMAWYGDTLIIVPQYPWFSDEESRWDGALYALSKEELVNRISGKSSGKLSPQTIPLSIPGLFTAVQGFDGFEGIAFNGDQVYMTIEASDNRGATGYVVSGQMTPDLSAITLNMNSIQNLPAQANRTNKSDEVIFVAGEEIITMYEVNGIDINNFPFARYFNLELEGPFPRPMPHIEYRLTDATALDEQGRFWVINIYWDGEPVYYSDADSIALKFGEGASHRRQENVERLLEMQYSPEGISLTERPPVQIKLSDLRIPRNWEALVRLDDDASGLHGFLIATDKYPRTVFAFIEDQE